jgi:hypothetical protein
MGAAVQAAAALPATPPLPAVQGYVEAITDQRIHGWAWSPAWPDTRLRVELRDHEVVLQAVTADLARPDLAQNGVGDGAHAFVLDLDPALAARASGFDVVAIAPDGTEVTLAAPPSAMHTPEDVRRLIGQLAGSQRLLHRNLQALMLASKAREPIDGVLERIAETQRALDARTAELELFVTRLDERLAALATADGAASPFDQRRVLALSAASALAVAGTVGVLLRLAG